MIKDIDLTLTPQEAFEERTIKKKAASKCGLPFTKVTGVKILRKSIDARRIEIKINLRVRLFVGEEVKNTWNPVAFPDVSSSPSCIVVGMGPAGLFAALALIERGMRRLVLERGKDVHERKRECALLCTKGELDTASNYVYGEGGAGAYSDGKLYTRSVKRGDVQKVLSLLVQHGADESILYETHPHIGTDRLPSVIENIRNTILKSGGEVHFNTKVVSLIKKDESVIGVKCGNGEEYLGPVILATGHSAKDVYRFLSISSVPLEAKDTAVGVRLEHPQSLIDQIQYHNPKGRGDYLPPATYSFVTQVNGRGVYSFCMCPGGSIVPTATEYGYLSVNGMSSSSRSGSKANSAMVVQIRREDVPDKGIFSVLDWVEELERNSFRDKFMAPAQRMADFVSNRLSSSLPGTTYAPGLVSSDLYGVLPPIVSSSLKEGFMAFNAMTRGKFLTNEAVMIASETRTSSPIRIIREDFNAVPGLYPAGEGSGYAGGIVSAAIDGTEVAKAVAERYSLK